MSGNENRNGTPELLDTTLREGEQTRGVQFTQEQKLHIAQLLDAFGIDFLEVGHPAAAPTVARDARAITRLGLRARTLAHARAIDADIDAAAASDADWVGIFFSVSDQAMESRFRKDLDACVALVTRAVERAKAHGLGVRYTPEDTVRSDFAKVARVARAAVEAGADRIAIADTTGHMTPDAMGDFVRRLGAEVPVPLNVHCHDDLGLATANVLAAMRNGARLADVCVNGLGERAGIANLAEVATLLTVKGLAPQGTWRLEMLPGIAEYVSRASGMPLSPTAPIVGRNAFSHNAGLHVAAVLVDPNFYESIPAHLVGRERYIVVDRLSGRAAVRHRLEAAGVAPTDEEVGVVLDVVKQESMNDVSDEDLRRLHATVRRARASREVSA